MMIIKLLAGICCFLMAASAQEAEIEIPEDIAGMDNVAVFEGDAEPLHNISFSHVAQFGDTEEIFIRSISGIAVDENGTVFLADGGEAVIHAYDPNGAYQFSIGRRGEGPGEFNSVHQPRIIDGNLYVLDVQQQRASLFNPSDGSFIRNINMSGGGKDFSGFPLAFSPLEGDRYLVYYNSMKRDEERFERQYIPRILDSEGEILQSDIVEFTPGEMFMMQSNNSVQIMSLPFKGESRFSLTKDEDIIWGFTDRVFLQIVSTDGEYLRSIYHSRENPALDRTAFLENYEDETIRNTIRGLGIPDVRQAFHNFYIDDEGRIWISLTTKNRNENEWWVLDETGKKIAVFMRPSNHSYLFSKDSYVYFREESEDGLQEVVKYSFELN